MQYTDTPGLSMSHTMHDTSILRTLRCHSSFVSEAGIFFIKTRVPQKVDPGAPCQKRPNPCLWRGPQGPWGSPGGLADRPTHPLLGPKFKIPRSNEFLWSIRTIPQTNHYGGSFAFAFAMVNFRNWHTNHPKHQQHSRGGGVQHRRKTTKGIPEFRQIHFPGPNTSRFFKVARVHKLQSADIANPCINTILAIAWGVTES